MTPWVKPIIIEKVYEKVAFAGDQCQIRLYSLLFVLLPNKKGNGKITYFWLQHMPRKFSYFVTLTPWPKLAKLIEILPEQAPFVGFVYFFRI
jgi:hypothetical protein